MKKVFLRIAALILALFLLFNCVWLCNWLSYSKYKKTIGYDRDAGQYAAADEEGYWYSVHPPEYPAFQGRLTVSDAASGEDGIACALIIWPKLGGKFEFGIAFYEPKEGCEGQITALRAYTVDEKGRPSDPDALPENGLRLLEENIGRITAVYEKAFKMWGIGAGK